MLAHFHKMAQPPQQIFLIKEESEKEVKLLWVEVENANPGGPAPQRRQNGVLGLHIFRNVAEKNRDSSSKYVKKCTIPVICVKRVC